MDEPLSNLDAQLRVSMRAELSRLHAENRTTTIYVTHDQVEAMTLGDRIAVLDAGRLQQIGTPHELYHHPVNTFVAGFIGSPSMNLAEVEVRGGQTPSVRLGGTLWPSPATRADSLASFAGGSVVLGLRPDALAWPAPDGSPRLDVTVAATEFLGSATLVLFEPPGKPVRAAADNDPASALWTARLDGYVPARIGDRMTLGVEIDSAYLFDPATGLALPHERTKVTVPA